LKAESTAVVDSVARWDWETRNEGFDVPGVRFQVHGTAGKVGPGVGTRHRDLEKEAGVWAEKLVELAVPIRDV
jgi:hypothetical protein